MAEKNKEINPEIETSNIFDDFSDDSSLVEEVNKIKKESNRDLFFYISKAWSFFQTIFLFWIAVASTLFLYIYIQNDENFKNSNILDPICPVFLSDIENVSPFCSSISSLQVDYTNKLNSLKESQKSSILHILERLYEIENFTKTKEVLFLANKSEDKLKVLDIMNKFDDLKNDFDSLDKQKIQCDSIIIDSQKEVLTMNCTAYSAWYEKGLRWFDGSANTNVKGTSLSIANSFLNFIEKKSDVFTIIDRQKVFKSEKIIWWKIDFTNKTVFNLKLKYNLK